MGGGADHGFIASIGALTWFGFFKDTRSEFDAQNTPHGVVQAFGRNPPRFRMLERAVIESLPAIGRHIHIEASIQRLGTIGGGASWDQRVTVPVTHHKAFKVHPVFQDIGEQLFLSVHALTLPSGKARHDRLRASGHSGHISCAVNVAQFGFADHCIALVDAIFSSAITQIVFRARDHAARAHKVVFTETPLQTVDNSISI